MKIFLFQSTVRTATLHAFQDAQAYVLLEMLGDGEVKSFKLKISTSEIHLLCCCRVGHGQEYFEVRYGRDV